MPIGKERAHGDAMHKNVTFIVFQDIIFSPC